VIWEAGIVPEEHVHAIWPRVLPMLQPAIDRADGRISADTVLQGLISRTHLLWLISFEDQIAAAFTTRVARYPLKQMLVIECLGGEKLNEWAQSTTEMLRSFAKDYGLDGIEMFGRDGWSRALKPYGWKHSMVVCEIDFKQEPTDG